MSDQNFNGGEDTGVISSENYPKMDLKILGGGIKQNTGKHSHNSSFSNNEAVKEEDILDEKEVDEMHASKKFKHVNIITDSDEFSYHLGSQKNPQSNSSQQQSPNEAGNTRPRSASGDQQCGSSRVGNQDSIQEGGEEEDEGKEYVSKLSASTQLIEESLRLDKGEFDCSTPKPRKQQLLKKISQSASYQHCNNAEESIEEDPKEGDVAQDNIVLPKINPHKDSKIIVDEVGNQEKQRSSYMETSMPIEEEPREEEGVEENKEVKAAKQERDHEKNYIKKIVRGDRVTGAEILRDLGEELPQAALLLSGSQRISEDVGDDGNYEDEDDEEEDEEDRKANK